MGDIADGLLDGSFDEYTGEYIGEPCGYPRSYAREHHNSMNEGELRTKSIRKELALLIKQNQEDNVHDPVESARRDINKKYGKGWRNGWIS